MKGRGHLSRHSVEKIHQATHQSSVTSSEDLRSTFNERTHHRKDSTERSATRGKASEPSPIVKDGSPWTGNNSIARNPSNASSSLSSSFHVVMPYRFSLRGTSTVPSSSSRAAALTKGEAKKASSIKWRSNDAGKRRSFLQTTNSLHSESTSPIEHNGGDLTAGFYSSHPPVRRSDRNTLESIHSLLFDRDVSATPLLFQQSPAGDTTETHVQGQSPPRMELSPVCDTPAYHQRANPVLLTAITPSPSLPRKQPSTERCAMDTINARVVLSYVSELERDRYMLLERIHHLETDGKKDAILKMALAPSKAAVVDVAVQHATEAVASETAPVRVSSSSTAGSTANVALHRLSNLPPTTSPSSVPLPQPVHDVVKIEKKAEGEAFPRGVVSLSPLPTTSDTTPQRAGGHTSAGANPLQRERSPTILSPSPSPSDDVIRELHRLQEDVRRMSNKIDITEALVSHSVAAQQSVIAASTNVSISQQHGISSVVPQNQPSLPREPVPIGALSARSFDALARATVSDHESVVSAGHFASLRLPPVPQYQLAAHLGPQYPPPAPTFGHGRVLISPSRGTAATELSGRSLSSASRPPLLPPPSDVLYHVHDDTQHLSRGYVGEWRNEIIADSAEYSDPYRAVRLDTAHYEGAIRIRSGLHRLISPRRDEAYGTAAPPPLGYDHYNDMPSAYRRQDVVSPSPPPPLDEVPIGASIQVPYKPYHELNTLETVSPPSSVDETDEGEYFRRQDAAVAMHGSSPGPDDEVRFQEWLKQSSVKHSQSPATPSPSSTSRLTKTQYGLVTYSPSSSDGSPFGAQRQLKPSTRFALPS